MSRDLKKEAHDLLTKNTQQIQKGRGVYTFSVPSVLSYPFQWFWDSCFHAIVWTYFDIARAKEEIRSLLSAQRRDGFLPYIIFWDQKKVRRAPWHGHWLESRGRLSFLPFFPKPKTTELIQPPVIAQSVMKIWKAEPKKDHAFIALAVRKLNSYFNWLATTRDPDGDRLLTIITPFESGLDWTPAYDEVLGLKFSSRPQEFNLQSKKVHFLNAFLFNYNQGKVLKHGSFHVEDVLVNTIYALNLDILSRLNRLVGNNNEERRWHQEARMVTEALIAKCWDPKQGAFFNLNGREEKRSTVLTIASIFPIILPWLPTEILETLITQHLTNKKEFWLPYPIPSVAANEPTFSPESRIPGETKTCHWRGSTWINTNWYLVHGLKRHGYDELAKHITAKSCELIAKSGFREYYNPYTGQGIAAQDFGWSTLIIDF